MGGERLLEGLDVAVAEDVTVQELVTVRVLNEEPVWVPDPLFVSEEVGELVEEALGQTEGVQDSVEKEVTVGLRVLDWDPVVVFEGVRVREAVREGVTVMSAVRLAV
jgi:hypothetical protein